MADDNFEELQHGFVSKKQTWTWIAWISPGIGPKQGELKENTVNLWVQVCVSARVCECVWWWVPRMTGNTHGTQCGLDINPQLWFKTDYSKQPQSSSFQGFPSVDQSSWLLSYWKPRLAMVAVNRWLIDHNESVMPHLMYLVSAVPNLEAGTFKEYKGRCYWSETVF